MEEVEKVLPPGPHSGMANLLNYDPDLGKHIIAMTQLVMRGESPLSAGQREMIAAIVSDENVCRF